MGQQIDYQDVFSTLVCDTPVPYYDMGISCGLPNEMGDVPPEMMLVPGFLSIHFSGNMGVIKTRPGYASSIAYNIDNSQIDEIIGTIAGDDTIFIVIKQGASKDEVIEALSEVVPNMR